MKFVFMADTHNHVVPDVPDGDVLVHCGDMTGVGSVAEVAAFAHWFGKLPHVHKICISGNHDFLFENNHTLARLMLQDNGIIYLEDEYLELEGVKIYGTPQQPYFYNWAFNREEEDLITAYARIPEGLDLLITHCPPRGILDETTHDFKTRFIGSYDLLEAVKRAKPRFHAFGHCHYSRGCKQVDGTTFINAAICAQHYNPVNRPWILEIQP